MREDLHPKRRNNARNARTTRSTSGLERGKFPIKRTLNPSNFSGARNVYTHGGSRISNVNNRFI
jgi:hypothetical protein